MLAKEPPATGCLTPTKVLARTNEGAKTGSKRGGKQRKKCSVWEKTEGYMMKMKYQEQ